MTIFRVMEPSMDSKTFVAGLARKINGLSGIQVS